MSIESKRKKAAALQYNHKDENAPHILAKGQGKIAEKIVETAKEARVPIVEDAALVSALLVLELGEEIPPELYHSVAKIMAFLYRLDKNHPSIGISR